MKVIPGSTSASGDASASPLAKYAEHWRLPGAETRYAATRLPGLYGRYEQEDAVVGRWLRLCPPESTVLDVPCGTGRFNQLLAALGHRVIRADLSLQMVAHARQLGPNTNEIGSVCFDLARPPLRPRSVDAVLIWRFFHHCRTPEDRLLVLLRAAALARRYVILSFYNRECVSYWSQRATRKLLGREPKCRGAIWTRELYELAAHAGLTPLEIHHYRRGLSINSAACFGVSAQ